MQWYELYPVLREPTLKEISLYVRNPLWDLFCRQTEEKYKCLPRVEYSTCSGAPGWNVKYKKAGRALCTLYPREGYFICLVCIGTKESDRVELLLPGCSEYVRHLYQKSKPMNGSRWLMIDVTDGKICEDVRELIHTRAS